MTTAILPRSLSNQLSGLLTSLLLAAGCAAPVANNPAPVKENTPANAAATATTTLRIGFTAADGGNLPIGPIGWAEKQGYLADELKEAGISGVKFYGFDSGPGVNEALAAGELDLAMNGDTPAIVGKTNGLRTRLINVNQAGINVYLVPAKGSNVKSVADLKGKTVGVRVGAIPHRYLVGVLQQAGLKGSTKIVNLTNSEGEAALVRGDIDAYAATAALAFRLKSQGYTAIDEAAKHQDLVGSNVTSASESFLTTHPQFVEQWYDVIARATQEIKAQPQAYYQFVSEINKQPLDVSEFTSPINLYPSEPLSSENLERLKKTQQFLVSEKVVKTEFPFDEWVYRK